jgi:hypothetical protein
LPHDLKRQGEPAVDYSADPATTTCSRSATP